MHHTSTIHVEIKSHKVFLIGSHKDTFIYHHIYCIYQVHSSKLSEWPKEPCSFVHDISIIHVDIESLEVFLIGTYKDTFIYDNVFGDR